MENLRKTEDPVEIFRMVLRSLESHRRRKQETRLLDDIRDHYALGDDTRRWPEELVGKSVAVDDFLKHTLSVLAPFVEMVVDIYEFLHEYVSTTGGRTQHFVIRSKNLSAPWSFDVSRLPKLIEWISAWSDVAHEEVSIDWEAISGCLGVDNGVFYGSVENIRLIQSLIVARRDGVITRETRGVGDAIYRSLRRAAQAWYRTVRIGAGARDTSKKLLLRSYLPTVREGGTVGIDLSVALHAAAGSYAPEEVFSDLSSGFDVQDLEEERDWRQAAAVFFCALWGLDEEDFRSIAIGLKSHEGSNMLFGHALELRGASLGEAVLQRLNAAVVPTGNVTRSRELTRQRLEILLLPYWKDRWFLFEVWTLITVIRNAAEAGARTTLDGVTAAVEPNVVATVWNLPTQKAKSPVATVSSDTAAVLVWFQRETRRLHSLRHMEPDIRITTSADPYRDVAIVECKDRVDFASKARAVVRSYMEGSGAGLVWLVNYEGESGVIDDKPGGIAAGFRPHAVPHRFRASLTELLRKELNLETPAALIPAERKLVIVDVSGSMDRKDLRAHPAAHDAWSNADDHVMWSSDVRYAASDAVISGSSAESGTALVRFLQQVTTQARITLITDNGGVSELIRIGAEPLPDSEQEESSFAYSVAGKRLLIIVV